jgi:hypothetical protein
MKAHATNETNIPLAELDARIEQRPFGALTLDPSRSSASSLTDLVATLADPRQSPHLAATASSVADAQLQSFPDNLFWDFDFYLASVHRDASAAPDYAGYLANVTHMTVALMRAHGQQSTIRFRYVHDFMYGFDWARWVRRDLGARNLVEPFGLDFLRQLESRGRDIVTLIEADDDLYPRLPEGVSRNPFPFSREPDEELPLYRLLTERRDVPVQAWRLDAQPDAGRDYDQLREDAAASLGLSR